MTRPGAMPAVPKTEDEKHADAIHVLCLAATQWAKEHGEHAPNHMKEILRSVHALHPDLLDEEWRKFFAENP